MLIFRVLLTYMSSPVLDSHAWKGASQENLEQTPLDQPVSPDKQWSQSGWTLALKLFGHAPCSKCNTKVEQAMASETTDSDKGK
jgi:hypothetical protein